MNPDGTLTYDPAGQFDSLNEGQSDTDAFQYGLSDGNGGTATATVTITILGEDQFDFVITDFSGLSGNSDAKVIDQFEQANATVQLQITAVGPLTSAGADPTVEFQCEQPWCLQRAVTSAHNQRQFDRSGRVRSSVLSALTIPPCCHKNPGQLFLAASLHHCYSNPDDRGCRGYRRRITSPGAECQ